MVNDLKRLLRDNVEHTPSGDVDVAEVVRIGRQRRTRRRRSAAGVGAAAAVVVVAVGVGGAALTGIGPGSDAGPSGAADQMPRPDAPTIQLTDAEPAVEGTDYRVLASHTNDNLNRDNGQYLDGVTTDGKILFRDGPRAEQLWPRFALMDPATGEKEWLPNLDVGQTQTWPVELDTDRLVLAAVRSPRGGLTAYVFDRTTRQWSTMQWPTLPKVDFPRVVLGPEGRLYVLTPETQGKPPEGGWPTGPDGEADDADADGDTFQLWSVSPTDSTDVRDEQLSVGDVAFTDSAMVWTDSSNGAAGKVHVRDLATGEETSFDPNTGEKCNLLSFGATGDRIMMSQYCGTYADGVRDDRVQILSTDGEQVATLQDSGVDGWLPAGSDIVNVSVYGTQGGTYTYDLATDRFLRVSDAISSWALGGPTGNERQVLWHTPVNNRHGATQWLGEWLA